MPGNRKTVTSIFFQQKYFNDYNDIHHRVKEQWVIIDKKMSIEEVVKKYPQTVVVFERFGLGCVGCQAALFENIQQGAEIHGIDVDALVESLNVTIKGS